jgi:hypothetical protein
MHQHACSHRPWCEEGCINGRGSNQVGQLYLAHPTHTEAHVYILYPTCRDTQSAGDTSKQMHSSSQQMVQFNYLISRHSRICEDNPLPAGCAGLVCTGGSDGHIKGWDSRSLTPAFDVDAGGLGSRRWIRTMISLKSQLGQPQILTGG